MKYILTILFLSASLARGQYSLALNLEKGNTYFLKINATLRFDGEMNGQKMAMSSTMTGVTRFKVVGATEDSYELEASYDSLRMSMKTPMGMMEYSSGNTSQKNELATGALDAMTNKHFNVTLLKNGAVRKISSPDTSGLNAMLRNFPMAEGIKKMFLMGHMKHSFNAKAMKENLEKLTAIFPNKKVNLNEVWGTTIMPDSGTDNSIKTSYQLTEYKGGIATIKGHAESQAGSSPHQGKGFPAIFELKGKSESTFQVDAATGWIREAVIRSDLTGQVQINQGAAAQNGKTFPIQVVATAKISSH
jgi:hypothetical protein